MLQRNRQCGNLRARSSARSWPGPPALPTGPTIWAMRSDCRSAGGPEGAQVARFDAVLTQRGRALRDHHGMFVEEPTGAAQMMPARHSAVMRSSATPDR